MFDKGKNHYLLYITSFLFISFIIIFYLNWQNDHKHFIFAMLDVGQGDAIFIESPTGIRVLIDAGPPRKISGELSKIISPFDRKIDAVIFTHPDQDHIGGFVDVFKHYKIGVVFEGGTTSSSEVYKNLENEIKNKNIPDFLARRGMRLNLGGGAVLDILFPDRDVSTWETNAGSVVARLIYGKESFLLTGDAPRETEKIILTENNITQLRSDILKVGHHGSRGSTSAEFLQAVSPNEAWISVGKGNSYGHPHQETLDELLRIGVKILRTDELGTIILKCDKMGSCKTNKLKN